MPCYAPLKAYYSKKVNPTGKRSLVFSTKDAYDDKVVNVPCGQCIGCRLKRSKDWAVRIMHEASLYKVNSFITLTFNDDNLPDDMSVKVRDWQLFHGRVRKKYGPTRFFHCGEYGTFSGRPHYHAILFGLDFTDKVLWKKTGSGSLIYRSKELEELWPFGFSSIGDVTFESAAYVARYVVKKITGPNASKHYEYTNPDTGEVSIRKPEYTTMSLKPGIGAGWFSKYSGDIVNHDFILVSGRKVAVPRYYDKLFERENIDVFYDLKDGRIDAALPHAWNNTAERLEVRGRIQAEKARRLKRNLGD